MVDPLTTAAMLGGKKVAMLWPLFIGMTVTKAGSLSIDVIKNWVVVVAVIASAIYMGRLFEKVERFQEQAIDDHRHIQNSMDAAFRERDFKLNYVYAQATKGNRYTWAMAQEDKEKLTDSIDENSTEDNVRHSTVADAFIQANARMTRIFERMDKIEEIK